ncbi:hypothetical protein NDU88_001183 [Pleurodeles waltl]|uniref:Uncharacterized protein n=1 Tax=Pleurodeles waltl TaxID=8319 RepID=A0AAV7TJE4_PLEWA|nr:hypothetical protein NDU88_001183 [Pleurodeles waltl]
MQGREDGATCNREKTKQKELQGQERSVEVCGPPDKEQHQGKPIRYWTGRPRLRRGPKRWDMARRLCMACATAAHMYKHCRARMAQTEQDEQANWSRTPGGPE